MNEEEIKSWLGHEIEQKDIIDSNRVRAMGALLDRDNLLFEYGTPLPPCWHWAFCLDTTPQSKLGMDGHPKKGGFLPDLGLPRRMWAGSRLKFHYSPEIGSSITKKSKISSITPKSGKSGKLVFILVKHDWYVDGVKFIEEEQDIVYRDITRTGQTSKGVSPVKKSAEWSMNVTPDSALLFRYSAVTFNSHRIHYDRPYCLNEEGYPGLVVHGPLIATILIEFFQTNNPNAIIKEFSFRAVSPLFEGQTFSVNGCKEKDNGWYDVWAENSQGSLATKGQILAEV